MKSLSCVRLLTTSWTAAYQAPPSLGFSRQQSWSGVPLPSPSRTPEGWHPPQAPPRAKIGVCVGEAWGLQERAGLDGAAELGPPGIQTMWSENCTGRATTPEGDRREGTQDVRKKPVVLNRTRIT